MLRAIALALRVLMLCAIALALRASAWSVPCQPRYGQMNVSYFKSLGDGYRTVI
jgi:hypothetical protein